MNERTPSREIHWSEIESLARDDAGAFERARRTIGLRVHHGDPLLGLAIFVVLMVGLLLIMVWLSGLSTGPLQIVLFVGVALPCCMIVKRLLTNRDRRRARIYLDHGLLPCPVCGDDKHTHHHDGLCPGCSLQVTPGVVRHYWEYIAEHGELERFFGRDILHIERITTRATLAAFAVMNMGLLLRLDAVKTATGIPSDLADIAFVVTTLGGFLCLFVILWWEMRTMKGVRATGPPGNWRCCLHCLHDLRGLDERGVCPECGVGYDIEHVRARWLLKSRRQMELQRSRFI